VTNQEYTKVVHGEIRHSTSAHRLEGILTRTWLLIILASDVQWVE
jgi:hypothetical protein